MRLSAERECAPSRWADARERLLDVAAWPEWVPGLAQVDRADASYWLTFADARRTRVRVELQDRGHCLDVGMVEGEVRSLDASIRLEDGRVKLNIELDLTRPLPGVLARELQSVYPARLLSSLLAVSEPVSPPSF